MKSLRALLVVPLVLMAGMFASPAVGQDVDAKGSKELTELGLKIDKAANRAAPAQVVDKIVNEFHGKFTESDVLALRRTGLGFGEISIVLALASQSGKSPSEILAMRKPGEGWGELARDLNFKSLGSVIKSVKATEKGVNRVALERSGLEKMDRPDKLEKPDKPDKPMRPEKPGR